MTAHEWRGSNQCFACGLRRWQAKSGADCVDIRSQLLELQTRYKFLQEAVQCAVDEMRYWDPARQGAYYMLRNACSILASQSTPTPDGEPGGEKEKGDG